MAERSFKRYLSSVFGTESYKTYKLETNGTSDYANNKSFDELYDENIHNGTSKLFGIDIVGYVKYPTGTNHFFGFGYGNSSGKYVAIFLMSFNQFYILRRSNSEKFTIYTVDRTDVTPT